MQAVKTLQTWAAKANNPKDSPMLTYPCPAETALEHSYLPPWVKGISLDLLVLL